MHWKNLPPHKGWQINRLISSSLWLWCRLTVVDAWEELEAGAESAWHSLGEAVQKAAW